MISAGQDPKARPDGGSTSFNALAFSTLLSSQETDAHHRETYASHPGLNLFVLYSITIAATCVSYPR
jgi:hypothetical protein